MCHSNIKFYMCPCLKKYHEPSSFQTLSLMQSLHWLESNLAIIKLDDLSHLNVAADILYISFVIDTKFPLFVHN